MPEAVDPTSIGAASAPRDGECGGPERGDAIGVGFRGDIDGLRAVAIVLIVGYHAGLAFFPGGFIGVDVFFVISGYLITRNLLAESDRTGRVALGRFWARRIRRLVPALALMLAVVLVLAVAVLSSLEWQAVAREARVAALYVSNIAFANQATDYFAEDVSSSLFLHTWSLGVEEQFYVVWPLLVLGATVVARRGRAHLRPLVVSVFAVTLVASFALCIGLTSAGSAHAFFGLPSRAWEFAAAGLLAAAPVPTWFRGRAATTAAAVVGLGLILAGLFGFGPATDYPGAWPLVPVVGTMLLILAGSSGTTGAKGEPATGNVVSAALAVAPVRAIGRVSYSWYLWHWPLILLAVAAFDRDDLVVTLGAAGAALALGAATHVLVENPLRFSRRLTGSPRRTYAMGAAVTAAVLIATVGLTGYSNRELAESAAATPATPTVSLADVRASKKDFHCLAEPTGANGAEYCLDGDLDGDRTIVMIGDSHARHWKPAFAEAARRQGIRFVLRWRSLCPAFPVRTVKVDGTGEDLECPEFRRQTDELIDELEPAAVITANSDDYGQLVISGGAPIDQARREALWRDAYEAFADDIRTRGIRFASVVDTPRLPEDPLDCVAEKGIDACAAPAAEARTTDVGYTAVERSVRAELGGVPALDINDVLCGPQTCPVAIDGTYVYTDVDHLYDAFVLTQVPAVEQFLIELSS